LLDWTAPYHAQPGFKERGNTSQRASERVAPHVSRLREKVLDGFRRYGPSTADEIAGKLNLTPFTVRPRVSELARMGDIEDVKIRRKNESGHTATVWRLKMPTTGACQ
jgi:predicted ArsR family transcriptional regulator